MLLVARTLFVVRPVPPLDSYQIKRPYDYRLMAERLPRAPWKGRLQEAVEAAWPFTPTKGVHV